SPTFCARKPLFFNRIRWLMLFAAGARSLLRCVVNNGSFRPFVACCLHGSFGRWRARPMSGKPFGRKRQFRIRAEICSLWFQTIFSRPKGGSF
ncbi:hypothetical protein, partial [Rhodovulum sulfidophilum]|uniref:hypothetical protein n=1 Tax=Rhodovulum sulfidophilum TaxID=35806 RepID=UPI001EE472B1